MDDYNIQLISEAFLEVRKHLIRIDKRLDELEKKIN